MVFRGVRLVGVIDFGDFVIGDPDNDFLCLLDSSEDDFGKEFGRKVLTYYGHKTPLLAERKAGIQDAYWPIQQILYGYERQDAQLLHSGICHLPKLFESMAAFTLNTWRAFLCNCPSHVDTSVKIRDTPF